MKAWEMIKELTENPSKKFKTAEGYEANVSKTGLLTVLIYKAEINANKSIRILGYDIFKEDDWEEIKTPVSLLEALQAWANGKTISCISFMGNKYIYPSSNDGLIDTSKSPLSQLEILRGVWYIEND